MSPYRRATISAVTVLAAVLIFFIGRTLIAYGVFEPVAPGFAGTCTKIAGIEGPEDIAIDAQSGFAFVSATDYRAFAQGKPAKADGLYVLPLKGPAKFLKLSGAPANFHPHGISLYRDPNGLTLMAVNHRADGTNSVEQFDVSFANGMAALHHTGSIESKMLVAPNAIAAVDRERFYLANDHGSLTALGRKLDDLFVLPRANILFFDGLTFRVVAERLAFANGLALAPDGRFLYASESFARRIDAFRIQPVTGTLEQAATLDIPAAADNLRFDAQGNLWLAGWPKVIAMNAYRADPAKPAPSAVFRIALANGIPQSATQVYANTGEEIGGSSVAAVLGKRMLIGGPFADHVLDCVM